MGHPPEGLRCWCLGMTKVPGADCLKIQGARPPGALRACLGLYRDNSVLVLVPFIVQRPLARRLTNSEVEGYGLNRPGSGQPVVAPRFEGWTDQIRRRCTAHPTMAFAAMI